MPGAAGGAAGWTPPTYLQETSEADTDDNDDAAQDETATPVETGQRVSYIRVSSAEQNLARQREMIGPVDREF